MANTGIKTVLTLRKYVDGVATNETKVNDPSDPDYITPYEDLVDCPTIASTTATTATTASTQSTTATTETTGTTQSTTATTATTASTQATTATTASTQATTATTASTQATTAIPCYNYQADVPQQSGESLEVTYIDCDGVEQSFVYYWNSGNTSVQWCARSIVGANYPVEGPFNQCEGNQPLPTTQATTATTATTTLNPTCHEVTYDSSVYGLDQDRYGIAYVDYQGNFVTATFNGMLSSPNGSELIYYVCANSVSNDVWDVTNNVAVPQYNPSLVYYDSGTACEGFCEPPGGGGL